MRGAICETATRRSSPKSNDRRAFSLVELITVIGIIAILVALILPAIRMVREQALVTQ
jgi:prepilin-type N-terminal cleavage/methylation domain-containing protein